MGLVRLTFIKIKLSDGKLLKSKKEKLKENCNEERCEWGL